MSFHDEVSTLPPTAQLRVAIKAEDAALLRSVLIAHPELLSRPDESGRTPLHLAAEWQRLPIVAALVELGADVAATDQAGYTPRDYAQWSGEYRMGAYSKTCQQIVACLDAPPPGT